MEFDIKRNSLKNTRLMYTALVSLYFGEKSALLKADADRDCRPRQFQVNRNFGQDGGGNTMEKRLKVFRAHSRIFFGGLKSLSC